LWSSTVLVLTVLAIGALMANTASGETCETLSNIEVRLTDGVDPLWVPVGTFTEVEVNVSVIGSLGSDLTNDSQFLWEVSPDIVSWIPRAPNVIHIYPEWYGDLVV
ncbi:MAG: hypothetical protein GWN39_12770, partial [Thermoplasmata archaeon]|nr:hypothetical protein [Thermoplasmata archaeon]NIV79584.1 hypothetical protein [Thermoplasmata archaeon]